ncbi:hypothetical protein LMH87_006960 [Akanthomyces muscarius]|uniref:Uncharacterized protein n=1 Tax=Akanthomyces muscarius TaxID=2231603 RepID=A0A9W8UTB5_AKAMU|nr:hypothetical protein LMH87_006960 [Akanthomyces muscarius]KAJ4165325.1 hypothetical protein LMH87_006960 [Akanthomyces muscarius]
MILDFIGCRGLVFAACPIDYWCFLAVLLQPLHTRNKEQILKRTFNRSIADHLLREGLVDFSFSCLLVALQPARVEQCLGDLWTSTSTSSIDDSGTLFVSLRTARNLRDRKRVIL